MPKTQVKTENQKVISNLVYDPFTDKCWDLERFFEVMSDYFEGNPQGVAEDLIQVIRTLNDLEFDEVDINDPETWSKIQTEMESCFTPAEVGRILNAVIEAQSPSQKTQREAIDFFANPQDQGDSSTGTTEEQTTTGSIEPVNDSD